MLARCKDSHTTYFEGISTPPDNKYSKKEISEIEKHYAKEQKRLHAKRQVDKFKRLEKYSLDDENQKIYKERAEKWNKLSSALEYDILEYNEDSERSIIKYSAKELLEQSLKINNYLNSIGISNSKWSGKTFVKTIEEMPMSMGVKKRVCDIWLREDASTKTIIHEHLHARSSSWLEKKLKKDRGFEEGTCELLAEEICKRNNIPYKETYREYVEPLRKFNSKINKYESDYDFALALFEIDMDKREQWLIDLAEEQGLIKSVVLKQLIKKVRNGK